MKDLISIAVLIATLYGGSLIGEQLLQSAQKAVLTKAARGLPNLTTFSQSLTARPAKRRPSNPEEQKRLYCRPDATRLSRSVLSYPATKLKALKR